MIVRGQPVRGAGPPVAFLRGESQVDAVDILMEARTYIEKGWCQEREAVNSEGQDVDFDDPQAVSWCVYGSLSKVLGEFPSWREARELLKTVSGAHYLTKWNDDPERTQAEVLEAFDEAIALGMKGDG